MGSGTCMHSVCARGGVCTACCGPSGSMGVSACTWVDVVGAGCTYVFRRAVHMCIFSCMDTRSFLCVYACVMHVCVPLEVCTPSSVL